MEAGNGSLESKYCVISTICKVNLPIPFFIGAFTAYFTLLCNGDRIVEEKQVLPS